MIDKDDAIAVVFSKQQVRQIKLAHFLKTFGPDALSDGPKFAAGSGDEFVRIWTSKPGASSQRRYAFHFGEHRLVLAPK